MAAKPNRNQHWVPQFYLRYFATPESRESDSPKIWAFPIDKGDEFLTNPRNVAAKRDLYACCSGEVDKRLTDLEDTLGCFWSHFANEHYPLDEGFKKGLSLFLATLFLRHPRVLDGHKQAHEMWVKAIDGAPKDENGNPSIRTIEFKDSVVEVTPSELNEWRNATESDIEDQWGKMILEETGELAKYFLTLPWFVLFTETPSFITCDHPVALWHPEHQHPAPRKPGTIIYFPISPTRLLVLGDPRFSADMAHPVIKGGAALFNYLIFRSAYKHVFSAWDPINVCAQVCGLVDHFQDEQERQARRRVFESNLGKIGRNEPCPCGSGTKYKRCCGTDRSLSQSIFLR